MKTGKYNLQHIPFKGKLTPRSADWMTLSGHSPE
jgi:hypothetical protein